jgi:molybdopterin-binding protein
VITAQSVDELQLKPGDALCAVVKTTAVHLSGADNRISWSAKPRQSGR